MVKTYERILSHCKLESMRNKTILITGSNGLIGGALAELFLFLNEKYEYNINLILSSLNNKSRFGNKVKYISKDLSLHTKWSELADQPIDFCFYCSGYGQPKKFLKDPMKVVQINTTGLYDLLNKIYSRNKYAKCIFMSSSEIYAFSSSNSSKESETIRYKDYERSNYLLSKLIGETIINDFIEKKFDAKSVRVSFCYGPGYFLSNDDRVMSDLLKKAIKEPTIDLFDEGNASRKYIHISDCCAMILNILLRGTWNTYNIGGKEEITIYNMAKIIGNKFGKRVKKGPSKHFASKSVPKRVSVSVKRYEEEFGNIDFKPFNEGLMEFINWYDKENLNIMERSKL